MGHGARDCWYMRDSGSLELISVFGFGVLYWRGLCFLVAEARPRGVGLGNFSPCWQSARQLQRCDRRLSRPYIVAALGGKRRQVLDIWAGMGLSDDSHVFDGPYVLGDPDSNHVIVFENYLECLCNGLLSLHRVLRLDY